MNCECWIKFLNKRLSRGLIKFPPLPQGEGRGEGERDFNR